MAEPALEFVGADLGYKGTVVLPGVDLTLAPGRTLALVGHNGSGKSTLIKSVIGLADVIRGTVRTTGRTAYVPQLDTLDPDFPISVRSVVLLGRYRPAKWWRPASRADRRAAAEALDKVGLADRAGTRFGLLSGGQRQRVLIARALAADPALLLLDEPFNGVDADSQEAILGDLAALRESGTATVMSTHDAGLAERIGDRVLRL